MTPRNKSLPSINPRDLSKAELYDQLKKAGYVTQQTILRDLFEMLFCRLPLLIEGQRGAGKTALGEYLAKAFNLDLYYLQCVEGLSLGDILYEWEKSLQDQFVQQATKSGISLAESRQKIWTTDFLKIGEVLSAFSNSSTEIPNILIIDEIDKLPSIDEDMLLQVLARNYAQIPRLEPSSLIGLPEGCQPPIVFLTSNNLRSGVSAPLRSRCLYTFIPAPTADEEMAILTAQVENITPHLTYQIVRLLTYLRLHSSIEEANKPALREAIGLARSLVSKNSFELNLPTFTEHLSHLAKSEKDKRSMLQAKDAIIQFVKKGTS